MRSLFRYLLFATILLLAIILVAWKYYDYLVNPWTRDGQVMANVIRIAPRVSGPVVDLPIRDNQHIKAGDLLFRIDPRTFETDLALAKAKLDLTQETLVALDKQVVAAEAAIEQAKSAIIQANSDVKAKVSTLVESKKTLDRNAALVKIKDVSPAAYDKALRDYQVDLATKEQADAALLGAQSHLRQAEAQLAQVQADRGLVGPGNSQLREAKAQLETAQLNLNFTEVKASVDGMIANLNVRLGSQAVANQPFMALIDENSFWIAAYFRESLIAGIKQGDAVTITLMSYPDIPLRGRVDSVGWGIAVSNGSTGQNLLPNVAPTFQWIRLAQRIPVRVIIEKIPESVVLRVGQTASVLIQTGRVSDDDSTAPAAPS
ncbi:MAG: HlyD family secretion protein, partial [Candidatus Competibacteraceae bacterium]|nr:HlyD family secretion protein [Candidatus Competibacteraceae bacterium]